MSELGDKVQTSIDRLRAFEPPEGYYLAFSGGKDSVVCKALLDLAGCKYDATYRVTSVDPPELVRFIKNEHPDVKREIPRYDDGKPITMWNLIPKKLMPPTRMVRYCCTKLKESGGDGRMTITGVRWDESRSRKKNQGIVTIQAIKAEREGILAEDENFRPASRDGIVLTNDNDESRRLVEQCYRRNKTTVNPIIDWTESEVWEFIRAHGVHFCDLYTEGFKRLGCIGCPMASTKQREAEFSRWPKYKNAYLLAFEKMLAERERRGKMSASWRIGTRAVDIFNWWMKYDVLPGQMTFDELEEEEE